MFKRLKNPLWPNPLALFGIRSFEQVSQDMGQVLRGILTQTQFQIDPSSLELLRPDLAFPAYAGLIPEDGLSPVLHLFDRTRGGKFYSQRVTRQTCRDFRGGSLSYDEHDGTDFVCPPGTPLTAAAPGRVVLVRDQWLRGGLTVTLDHGYGLLTQYSHCYQVEVELGQVVKRGATLALSGASGLDMFSFFPWIPPHIHFMVWWGGQPVDPFLSSNEAERPGIWLDGHQPRPTGTLAGDPDLPTYSPITLEVLELALEKCRDPLLLREFAFHQTNLPALAALVEDAMHHQAQAWPPELQNLTIRPQPTSEEWEQALKIKLSLPLSLEYKGIRLADTRRTQPSLT